MGQARRDEDAAIEDASQELARTIWQTVLLAQNETKARGLIGKATRRTLVQRIVELMRLVRSR
jgi:hypothetical protein